MTTLPPDDQNGEQNAAPVPPQAPQQPAPQAPPAYQQPAQPAQPGYPQPVAADPVGNIQLNYWLSVFFTWVPALIFWLIEKDKGDQRATAFHVANFNFSLLRTIVGVGGYILGLIFSFIPVLNILFWIIVWAAMIVLFVFHIIAAAKVANEYRSGGKTDPFIFNLPLVK